ncbi:hypothetical protein [Paludisphaera mucosa]|uniref:Tetratricopeptide repeat protein n=1 Tax=Paludisphaera mucosa TaxID=3030827 RepID=A0ABT6FJY4_9BACT|nr:hypothetical protein [Paludisphaera mucosa]MDG3007891.1 hypothetical protein [Paludisphaera mucosa]
MSTLPSPPAGDVPPQVAPPAHIILTLHGIRTFGEWQERLEKLVTEPGVEFKHFRYGVLSLISYAVPFLRWIRVRLFRRSLRDLARRHPDARIDVVAHSFGTYIAARAIASLSRSEAVKIDTVILAGSVLKVNFPWDDLKAKGVVRRVINECGTEDDVLLVTQLFILLTGMAGRIGFTGLQDRDFTNRFYKFGHGGYFQPWGDPDGSTAPDDWFMKRQWLPLLAGYSQVLGHSERTASPLTPLQHFLLTSADPIKLAAYGGVVAVAVGFPVYWITTANANAREAHRSLESYASATAKGLQAFGRTVREDVALQNHPALSKTRAKLLESAEGLFDGLLDRASHFPNVSDEVERDVAEAYLEMARIMVDLEKGPPAAIASYGDAIRRFDRQHGLHPEAPRIRWGLGSSYMGRGEQHIAQQRVTQLKSDAAEADLKVAVDLLEPLLGTPSLPKDECRNALVGALTLLGNSATDPTVASEYFKRAAELADPQSVEAGWLNNNNGRLCLQTRDFAGAQRHFVEACRVFESLKAGSLLRIRAHDESLAWALVGRGNAGLGLLPDKGSADYPSRREEALSHMRRACELFSGLDRDFVDNPRYKVALASGSKDLGEALRTSTHVADEASRKEAAERLGRAVGLFERLSASQKQTFGVAVLWSWAEHSLGWVLVDLGKIREQRQETEAESCFTAAIGHFERALELQPGAVDLTLGHGFGLITRGRYLESRAMLGLAKENFGKAASLFDRLVEDDTADADHRKAARDGWRGAHESLARLAPK